MVQLRKVARVSGHIVERHADGVKLQDPDEMQRELNEYAKKIGPWATRQSAKLLEQVQKSNRRAYQQKSKAIGLALKLDVGGANVETAARKLLNEQVALIKSLPTEAGLRAQKIAWEAVFHGTRVQVNADAIIELQKQMGLTTEVTLARATLIARTETARATASINQARAQAVGSRFYRWHNSGDGNVRPSHKTLGGRALQGRIFSWDEPPTLDDGMTGHPGTFPNCRCFAEPVFDVE